MENTIILYHYVRDNTKMKAFSTKEFRQQLEYLSKKNKIIALGELIEKKPNGKTCVLTFDDGIKDGYKTVLPILEEFGFKANFFLPTSILETKKILAAQKRHLLLSKIGAKRFAKEFNALVPELFKVKEEGKKEGYPLDEELTSNLKYMLDNAPDGKKTVGKIFARHFDEEEEFEKIYLSKSDMKKMQDKGMEFGIHGHKHAWLGKLHFYDAQNDLQKSVSAFKNFFLEQKMFISYPFGSYSPLLLRAVKQLGFEAGLTTEKKINGADTDNLLLGRFDCIDLYPRKK